MPASPFKGFSVPGTHPDAPDQGSPSAFDLYRCFNLCVSVTLTQGGTPENARERVRLTSLKLPYGRALLMAWRCTLARCRFQYLSYGEWIVGYALYACAHGVGRSVWNVWGGASQHPVVVNNNNV